MQRPHIVVLSSLFPSSKQPLAGVFIKERMFRVGKHLPLTVISPQPWFPLQGLLRLRWPNYRPSKPQHELIDGVEVFAPRFLALPGILRRLDAPMMAFAAGRIVRKLKRAGRAHVIDAHFAYPDGVAAARIGQRLKLPVTMTLRGTETHHAANPQHRAQMVQAMGNAARVFSVSDSLRQVALRLDVPQEKTRVIGNGVDLRNFTRIDQAQARRDLNVPLDAKVLISVGGLVERKGFHRVIECLPELLKQFPTLHYLIVGSAGPEGDWSERLKTQVQTLGLQERVHFLGQVAPANLHKPLSAADVFALATRNEGWANVFLEAMACGLPVVTTRVGGNAEVVTRPELGSLVEFGDAAGLRAALADALGKHWNRALIRQYAEDNTWDRRVTVLIEEFQGLVSQRADAASEPTTVL